MELPNYWPVLAGLLLNIVGPILLNAYQFWQNRKKAAADAGKVEAEKGKTEVDAAALIVDTAKDLLVQLKERVEFLEAAREKDQQEWVEREAILLKRIREANEQFTNYVLDADRREEKLQARINELELAKTAADQRERELWQRIEKLEVENHALKSRK